MEVRKRRASLLIKIELNRYHAAITHFFKFVSFWTQSSEVLAVVASWVESLESPCIAS